MDKFLESYVSKKNVNNNSCLPYFARHVLPKRVHNCLHCDALMWLEEKLHSSSDKNPRFGFCCLQGKIKIPQDNPLPNEITIYYNRFS